MIASGHIDIVTYVDFNNISFLLSDEIIKLLNGVIQ